MDQVEQIRNLLSQCTEEQRLEIFQHLRTYFPIHPLEKKLNIPAEIILEAIDRASDLTMRGVRGVIAEAAFEINIVQRLSSWRNHYLREDFPYDFLLEDNIGQVRVQLKMQRLKNHIPMIANEAYRRLPSDKYVVETQRTRKGQDTEGADTRPYRFGEFDILAVSMHPSTNDWSRFMYTVERWLIPRPENPSLMLKFQPVSMIADEYWTDDFETCVHWLRSNINKRIST